jgi:hypothetical protein
LLAVSTDTAAAEARRIKVLRKRHLMVVQFSKESWKVKVQIENCSGQGFVTDSLFLLVTKKARLG